MTIKKLVSFVALSMLAVTGWSQPEPMRSTLSFDKTRTIDIKSTTALVNVTVNATALKGDNQTIETSALQSLSSILPDTDWKIVDFSDSQADSGASNIKIVIQARLTHNEIKILTEKLKNNNSNNSSFKVDVLSYAPDVAMIDQAKDDMMIKMYQSIQHYVQTFNKNTNSQYVIQEIRYHANALTPYKKFPEMQLRAVDNSINTSEKSEDMAVSKKITMHAYVTLVQDLDTSSNYTKTINQQSLPPQYLEVKDFKLCLETQDNGTWQSWCLPRKQPKACSDKSWAKLSRQNQLPLCDEHSNQ